MTKTMGLDLSAITRIAASLHSEPVANDFDQPLGVGPYCLSASQLVSLVKSGATEEQSRHLEGCVTCRENVSRLATTSLQSDKDFLQSAFHGRSVKAAVRPPLLTAILGIDNADITVAADETVSITCKVFPAFSGRLFQELDVGSLRLAGALEAGSGEVSDTVDLDADGIADYVIVHFKNARLGQRVRDGIAVNQGVTDKVRLYGTVSDKTHEVVGQATLRFAPRTL